MLTNLDFIDPNLEDWFSFIVESSQKSLSQLVAVMRNGGRAKNPRFKG